MYCNLPKFKNYVLVHTDALLPFRKQKHGCLVQKHARRNMSEN